MKAEGEAYDDMIKSLGGIDLQLLGIGLDGHIGFNEPDSFFTKETHLVKLDESTIKANARFFASEADVPTKALTMGIGTILNAKKIVILANGDAKHAAVAKMLEGKLDTSCPASMLNLHSDVTVICDEAAYNG
jgi:glucosamine-6-phosphate deaminase